MPLLEPFLGDPEQALVDISFPLDPDTLRETVPDPALLMSIRAAVSTRLAETTDAGALARLLGLRAIMHRLLGDLDDALSDAQQALTHAESTQAFRRIALARARLARVHQWRGEHATADRLYDQANSSELPTQLRAALHVHIARSAYEQGRLIDACTHLERALHTRRPTVDRELSAEVQTALDAIAGKAAAIGFGPIPRQQSVPEQRMPAGDYADVQPYSDGRAWVREADGEQWVAIDESGKIVIDSGYDDVRPFRHGVAIVRRARSWGAIDRHGKVVLSCSYDLFRTALVDGRYVEGFTEEGLAVVELAGRKGVVDRTGRILLEPAYQGLVIHPIAFLIMSADSRWGALDRRGATILDPVLPNRAEVIEHMERLLNETRLLL